jgi:hypothetical protein
MQCDVVWCGERTHHFHGLIKDLLHIDGLRHQQEMLSFDATNFQNFVDESIALRIDRIAALPLRWLALHVL